MNVVRTPQVLEGTGVALYLSEMNLSDSDVMLTVPWCDCGLQVVLLSLYIPPQEMLAESRKQGDGMQAQ